MSDETLKLLETVLELPEDERAEFAEALMESLQQSPEDDAEFAEEIKRRIAEVESGAVKTIPWEVVHKRLRERL
ncbi:MAG TPA: addiction module protein [Pirellulaceae bacterium]|nr:addiction module protein [Pirellulaceae bacterium]